MLAVIGRARQGTPWIGHHSVTGLKYGERQPFTPVANLDSLITLTLCMGLGRIPEYLDRINSTQKGSNQTAYENNSAKHQITMASLIMRDT